MTDGELPRDDDGTLLVPKGVLEGIDDAVEGRTADGDDLDAALSWMGDGGD
ncbi:hypothetical protein [Natrinema sp. DC36]|uniref:hypothetical protein n=1 Tax=Natrinema sp. DC36 TaxID=2878680 RepID=UPI001CEFCF10|nr:hypothetical protein [Natrinema sp. DC36]